MPPPSPFRWSQVLGALVVLLSLQPGCVKEISSEERLERESPPPLTKPAVSAEQLRKLDCSGGAVLNRARNVNRPETERLTDYRRLVGVMRKKVGTFEEAINRNPDLRYGDLNGALMLAHDACVQHAAEVRQEFERYVRELVEAPTAQELRKGSTVTVRRVDFNVLRGAIKMLEATDRDALLSRIDLAEKQLESEPPRKTKTKTKRRPTPSRRRRTR